jgi:hypothetical protein
MNTPMIPQDDIEALLAEDSELLKRYRALPLSEPGKHLDAAILGRASNAVRRPAARQRWLIPIASAASVVAAAGIGWRVHLAQQEEQAAGGLAPAAKYDVMEIDLQSGDQRRALDTAVMPPQQQRERAEAAGNAAPQAKSQPTLSEIISGPARDNGVIIDEPHTRTDHAEPGRAPEQRQSLPRLSDDSDARSTNQAPAAAAAAAPRTESDSESPKLEALGITGSRTKRVDAEEGESDGFGYERRRVGEDELLAPADWIDHIRNLVSARRTQQAREQVERFRAAYPSYRLPPDLRRFER